MRKSAVYDTLGRSIMQAFTPGQKVTWIWKPRGGYGYEIPCRAEVVSVTPKRIRIKVWRVNRITRKETPEIKTVMPSSLKVRSNTDINPTANSAADKP